MFCKFVGLSALPAGKSASAKKLKSVPSLNVQLPVYQV